MKRNQGEIRIVCQDYYQVLLQIIATCQKKEQGYRRNWKGGREGYIMKKRMKRNNHKKSLQPPSPQCKKVDCPWWENEINKVFSGIPFKPVHRILIQHGIPVYRNKPLYREPGFLTGNNGENFFVLPLETLVIDI